MLILPRPKNKNYKLFSSKTLKKHNGNKPLMKLKQKF